MDFMWICWVLVFGFVDDLQPAHRVVWHKAAFDVNAGLRRELLKTIRESPN